MSVEMNGLIQRINQLEARVTALEQPKARRKRSTQASSGNINLDDEADLFTTALVQSTAAPAQSNTAAQARHDCEEISLGILAAESPAFGCLD